MGGGGSRPPEPPVGGETGEGGDQSGGPPAAALSASPSAPSQAPAGPSLAESITPPLALPGLRGRHFALSAPEAQRLQATGGCSICASDLLENEAVLELHCQHLFHAHCLLEWLAKQPTCPLCRCEALDIALVVDTLVAKIHNVGESGQHHHEYLPLLEQMIALARDKRFVQVCARSSGCLAALARSHGCPMVRAMVLELFLIFSQMGELHSLIWEAQDDLLALLGETLGHERAPLRAASCGLIWNLAAVGPNATVARASLDRFLGALVQLLEDADALVAHRATRALGFLAQAPDRARRLLQGELAEPMLRRAAHLDPGNDELSYLLQTLSQCIEFAEGQEEAALLYEGLFPRLPEWLRGHESVRHGALQISLLLSRFQRSDHMAAWLHLYEENGALGSFLKKRSEHDPSFNESRAHAIGTVWNLAMNEEWRKPLAELVLPGLLAVVEEDEGCSAGLDGVTRERLVTALWHLSKNEAVAADPRWVEAAELISRQVACLSGEVQIHGLQLLEHLGQAHNGTLASRVMPMVWQLATADGWAVWKEAVGIFSLFLSFTAMPMVKEWLWKCEAFPAALVTMLQRLEAAGSDGSASSEASYAKALLVGALCHLAMDEGPVQGRREVLGQTILPLMPKLFRDKSILVMSRACMATFHLTKACKNAQLLHEIMSPGFEGLVIEMLQRLRKDCGARCLPLLHVLSVTLAVTCARCGRGGEDVASEDCAVFQLRLGSSLLEWFASVGFFESRVDAAGCIVEADASPTSAPEPEGTTARTVCVTLNLLVHLTCSSGVCAELMNRGFFKDGSALLRLLSPNAVASLAVEARAHVLGIIWNMAVAKRGAFRFEMASLVLGRLFQLARVVEEGPSEAEEVSQHRLTMALAHLARDSSVAARPEWLELMEAIVKLVRPMADKEPDAVFELLGNLVEAHGLPAARSVAPLLWEHVTREDVAEQANAQASIVLLSRISAVHSPAACLEPLGDVGAGLAGAVRRLARSSARTAPATLTCLVGALWNLAMDNTPGWREKLGQAVLPELLSDALWWAPLKEGNTVLIFRIATCLLHLSAAPAHHGPLGAAAWAALEAGELPDDSCAQVLRALCNVLQELCRQHGSCGRPVLEFGERAVRVLSGKRWTSGPAPRSEWPQSSAAAMALLVQVSALCCSAKESLASSALLRPGGLVFEALQPRPVAWAPAEAWERDVGGKAAAVAFNLAVAKHGAMRSWLAGILLKSLQARTVEALEELDDGECDKLVLALHLCSDDAVEAELWAPARRQLAGLVERAARRGSGQALAFGLLLLEKAFPGKGWGCGLPLARRILAYQSCPLEVRTEALELFTRAET